MRFASALFLSCLFAAATPAPDEFSVKPIARGEGFLMIENLPTPQGLVDVVTPWGDDWALVRLGNGPWSAPVAFESLGGIQMDAVVSVTFCVSYPIMGPHGSILGATAEQEFTVSAGGEDVSLEQAAASVKAQTAAIGGFHVPCPH